METRRLTIDLLGHTTPLTIIIANSWQTTLTFEFLARSYSFTVTRWSGSGLRRFMRMFHRARERDERTFGRARPMEEDDDYLCVDATPAQRINIVVQMCRDIMAALDAIGKRQQRSVVDYAIWFRERKYPALRRERDELGVLDPDYCETITLLACHLIIHVDFLYPSSTYDLVVFAYPDESPSGERWSERLKRNRS